MISGDYKIEDDGFSTPFEPVKCDVFVTESTFGLPVYSWESQETIFEEINQWWYKNKAEGRTSILFGYSLGKAQRLLNGLNMDIGKVFVHGAIYNSNMALESDGVSLKPYQQVSRETTKKETEGQMIIAPPSAFGTPWMRRFSPYATGMASGWMNIRGARRRRAADRGFVLSDHADWDGLLKAIKATEASKVFVTHGYTAAFSRYLNETGIEAMEVETDFIGELSELNGTNDDPQS